MKSLELSNIKKHYGHYLAIKGVSFAVEPGEFVVMVGPSGCGKSTLLRSIAGLETIDGGSILINGKDITDSEPAGRGVAMVFQNYALYPHMSVRENMGFALKIAGRPKAEIEQAVSRAAKILRIEDHLDKKPRQLSGGQKQRVAIGRAITRAPDVFLFDEPLSNLDAALRSQMRIELGRLHAELGATIIYVTHDQTEAMTMASRIVVLNDGRIEQMGTPLDLYNAPANRFVAGFLGSPRMNFLPARVLAVASGSVTIALADGTKDLTLECPPDWAPNLGERMTLGVRPERIRLGGAGAFNFTGKVAVIESLGRETLLYADLPGLRTVDSESQEGLFSMQCAAQVGARMGDAITLSFDRDDLYVFSEDGTTRRQASILARA